MTEDLDYPPALMASIGADGSGPPMALQSRKVLVALIGLSVLVGCYDAALFRSGHTVGAPFQAIWSLVFILLLVVWVDQDCRERKNVYRPFEFGFLVFLFWLPYLPYYLLRTRRAFGLIWLAGFVLLFHAGYLFKWLIYLSSHR